MAWTDERVEKLKELWEQGKSASEIAKELGNVTRNAVIGKVHRMGLQSRAASADAKPDEASKKKPAKAAPKAARKSTKAEAEAKPAKAEKVEVEVELEEIEVKSVNSSNQFPTVVPVNNDEVSEETRRNVERVENESKRLNLMQLTERTCKWPIGDPATEDFWFCGHPSEAGKPYCQAHVELAFQAPMARRRG